MGSSARSSRGTRKLPVLLLLLLRHTATRAANTSIVEVASGDEFVRHVHAYLAGATSLTLQLTRNISLRNTSFVPYNAGISHLDEDGSSGGPMKTLLIEAHPTAPRPVRLDAAMKHGLTPRFSGQLLVLRDLTLVNL